MSGESFFIVGGAGFIGSHFVDYLLDDPETGKVSIYDNFSSGRTRHYKQHNGDKRLSVIRADVHDFERLCVAMAGHDCVIHLASNPDISAAVEDPDIDFREGTELTRNVVRAARACCVSTILYASGSGVYGEIGSTVADENFGPLIPISTYAASKLAGEALISSFAHMFGMKARVFRFANVVGRRQTHGVGYDFLCRLKKDPARLHILGDGNQSKSYIHVSDVVRAVMKVYRQKDEKNFEAYNVSTNDFISVKEIARITVETMGLRMENVTMEYSGGDRGWKGDVPIVRLDASKIRFLGWYPNRGSEEAIKSSIGEMLEELREDEALLQVKEVK